MDNLCNVTTGRARFSFVHLYKPYAYQPGQEEKYQVTVLVPKSDVDTKARIDAAIEAADVVLMDDDVRKIASLVKIARKTLSIVHQNIVFALGVKAIVLILGAFGIANMWEAVFADVGVSVIAILNSMRTLRIAKK